MRAESATEDVVEARRISSSTTILNRACDVLDAIRYDGVNPTHVKVTQNNAPHCKMTGRN